jgi:hypothetical protein
VLMEGPVFKTGRLVSCHYQMDNQAPHGVTVCLTSYILQCEQLNHLFKNAMCFLSFNLCTRRMFLDA